MGNPTKDVVKEGWISKRSRYLKVWRQRWGVLTRERFQTFKTQSHFFHGRSTEDFPPRHCLSAEAGSHDGDGHLMFLQIGGRKARMIQLKTDSDDKRSEWLTCIKESMRVRTGEMNAARDTPDAHNVVSNSSAATGGILPPQSTSPQLGVGIGYLVSNALGSDNDGILY